MIVSLSGVKRSGKSTVASILTSKFGFKEIALADPLRALCSKVFDIPLSTFLSDELKEKPFEIPAQLTASRISHIAAIIEHEWNFDVSNEQYNKIAEFLDYTFSNPRQILQIVGTEIIRGSIDDNIFLKLADRRIDQYNCNVVVSDVRFKVEQEWAKNKGAMMCLIKRPNLDLPTDSHISENQLTNEDIYGTIMTNDAELSVFKHDVHQYFGMIMSKRSN